MNTIPLNEPPSIINNPRAWKRWFIAVNYESNRIITKEDEAWIELRFKETLEHETKSRDFYRAK